ncbi:MAG: ferrochelatase [Actinobacteria bacterium]|nr:ferrochelatase [Actinomycetota bacterium]
MTGILLMAFGGPETRDAIGPFMTNLMGREPSPEVLARAVEKYDRIGGCSPLPTITGRQAAGTQLLLREMGYDLLVAVGMKYWRPFIGTAVANLVGEGAGRIIAISMSPHYSRVSVGAYEEELAKARKAFPNATIQLLSSWYDHPGFLAAVAEKIKESLPDFGDRKPFIIFSTHSLPVAHIESGDPYVSQVQATVDGVMNLVGEFDHCLAFQSKGHSPGPWLGPGVEEVLEQLAAGGREDVLLVPIGFVSDHMETLYDIDIAHREKAESLGLNFTRTTSLNDSPAFIRALAEIIKNRLV